MDKQFLQEWKDAEAFVLSSHAERQKAMREDSMGDPSSHLQRIGEAAGLAARLRMCIERIEERS